MDDLSARHRRLRRAAVVALASVLRLGTAQAEDSNFRPYLVGSRAAGMGGAFTALADDGSGPYYNPAGIAFVQRSQLSLAGSVYGVASGTIRDAMGDGNDFRYSNLQTLPTTTAGVFRLGPDDPAGGSALAITVYVPDSLNVDGRDRLGLQQNAYMLASQSQTVWAGLTYARRWGRLSVGVSGFLLLGTETNQFDLTILDTTTSPAGCAPPAACATRFGTASSRVDMTTYGAVGAIGVRWDASDALHLGFAVYSPEVGFGTRRVFARIAAPPDATTGSVTVAVVNAEDLHATPSLPLRLQGGIAWTSGPLTLSADVSFLAAREVVDDADRAADGLSRHVTRNAVVNGAVGLEYVAAERFPLRVGAFTDFSSAQTPVAGTDVNNVSRIDRFGGTASIGVRTEHTATDLGVMISGGSGTDLVPNNLDFSTLKTTTSSQTLYYLFLGTAYQF